MLNDITDTTGDVFLGLGVAMCPLPRPQVRSHPAEGLLPAPGLLRRRCCRATTCRPATRPSRSSIPEQARGWEAKTADAARSDRGDRSGRIGRRGRRGHRQVPRRHPGDDPQAGKPSARRWSSRLAELAYRQVQYEYDRLDRKHQGRSDKSDCWRCASSWPRSTSCKPGPLPRRDGGDGRRPERPPPVRSPRKAHEPDRARLPDRPRRTAGARSSRSPAAPTRPAAARRWPAG